MPQPAIWPELELLPWTPGDERRASMRRSSSLPVNCRPLAAIVPEAVQAQIRDVSAFGVGLVLPEPPATGGLMHLDFGAGVRTVLARAVHVTPHAEGWLVGCALVRELDTAGLRPFQAERLRAPAGDNRRWVRSTCDVEAICWSLDTTPGERSPARVLDISAGGAGLLLPCEFGPGTLLLLSLGGQGAAVPRVLLRVARSTQARGGWFLGCEFADRLGDEELAVLCGATSPRALQIPLPG